MIAEQAMECLSEINSGLKPPWFPQSADRGCGGRRDFHAARTVGLSAALTGKPNVRCRSMLSRKSAAHILDATIKSKSEIP